MLTLPPIMFTHFKGFYYPHYSTRDCAWLGKGWAATRGHGNGFPLMRGRVSRTYRGATQFKRDLW